MPDPWRARLRPASPDLGVLHAAPPPARSAAGAGLRKPPDGVLPGGGEAGQQALAWATSRWPAQ
jgi:hypothetical protein